MHHNVVTTIISILWLFIFTLYIHTHLKIPFRSVFLIFLHIASTHAKSEPTLGGKVPRTVPRRAQSSTFRSEKFRFFCDTLI